MATHRRDLPWLGKETFLTDGGMETTLIFHRGIDLPQFAAFPLLDDAKGRAELNAYYESYLAIARQHDRGFILDTATWRASTDWGAMLGYDAAALRKANLRAVEFIAGLRRKWERSGLPIILNGVIGPRGDAYQQGQMGVGEAQDYHGHQIRTFAETELDMITALTLNRIEEAIGITRAAEEAGLPCVISFTVETDGRLVDGMSLQEAIETTDKETDAYPIHYMINCAHPTHFDQLLRHDKPWIGRIGGMRANASAKSHAELDESIEVDIGDPVDLGRRYRSLQAAHPSIKVLGGCCGTDQRHLAAICEACATSVAAE